MAEEKKLFGMPAEKGRWLLIVLGFIINICLGSVYAYSIFGTQLAHGERSIITSPNQTKPFLAIWSTPCPHRYKVDRFCLHIIKKPLRYTLRRGI